MSPSLCLQVSGHLVSSRLLSLCILCVPTDCTPLSPFPEIGELTSRPPWPLWRLRVSGRRGGGQLRGRETGGEGEARGRGKEFYRDKE